jgi:hypothetical protein
MATFDPTGEDGRAMNRTNEARRARLRYVLAQLGGDARRRERLRRLAMEGTTGQGPLESRVIPLRLLRKAGERATRALREAALGLREVR